MLSPGDLDVRRRDGDFAVAGDVHDHLVHQGSRVTSTMVPDFPITRATPERSTRASSPGTQSLM
jgi:hypothetical protein